MKWIWKLALVALIAGCASAPTQSGVVIRKQNGLSNKSIPQIDHLVHGLKENFVERCYVNLLRRDVPETHCQHEIFGILERRWGMDYSDDALNQIADLVFFKTVSEKILYVIQTDRQVAHLARSKFNSPDELLEHYKAVYTFR
jgi:hypothetical protein